MQRTFVYAIQLVLLAAIGYGVFLARRVTMMEMNLQAFVKAQRATIEFVYEHDGEWPRSWGDLKATRPDYDFNQVAERVTFDFTADPKVIAAEPLSSFSAIKVSQPCYPLEDRIEVLVDAVKRSCIRFDTSQNNGLDTQASNESIEDG